MKKITTNIYRFSYLITTLVLGLWFAITHIDTSDSSLLAIISWFVMMVIKEI